ncbi:unnamed protein product [Mycena citricolor]|uniref:Large ribosomal subunit protein uL29m n=1 Tax=Mycena citricolor TaxID=2018698 RepID=A0AAD2K827_9AGAR|nr:unnamed protein product [Mycena citricolor]
MLASLLRAGRRVPFRSARYASTTGPSSSTASTSPSDAVSETVATAERSQRQSSSANSSAYIHPHSPLLSSDHGLYGFFRRKAPSDNKELVGEEQYETVMDPTIAYSGTPWLASELRLKSFKDLHTLWYVLLRERNLLATQRDEMRRLGLTSLNQPPHRQTRANTANCRTSMARIKGVMNERRLAYEGAVALAEEQREEATTQAILQFKIGQEGGRQIPGFKTHPSSASRPKRRAAVVTPGEKKARWTREQKRERKQQVAGERILQVA